MWAGGFAGGGDDGYLLARHVASATQCRYSVGFDQLCVRGPAHGDLELVRAWPSTYEIALRNTSWIDAMALDAARSAVEFRGRNGAASSSATLAFSNAARAF